MSRVVVTSAERLGLLQKLGRAYELAGELEKARDAYEKMLREAGTERDREAEWRALDHLASLTTGSFLRVGEDEELLAGVRRRARLEGDERGGIWASGGSHLAGQDLASALAHAARALDLARELGRKDLVARSTLTLGNLHLWMGAWDKAAALEHEAGALFAEVGDEAALVQSLVWKAMAKTMLGEPREGLRLGQEAIRRGAGLDNEIVVASNAHPLVTSLLEAGEYGEALAVSREGLRAARSLGNAPLLSTNLLCALRLNVALLSLDDARAAARECLDMPEIPAHHRPVITNLCYVSALAGDWEEAHARAVESVGDRPASPRTTSISLRSHLVIEALLRGGDEELARESLVGLAGLIGENRRFRISYLRARAVLSLWEDDAVGAASSLRETEALAEEIGLLGELWQVRAALGELHERRGEPGEASRAFARAARILRTLASSIGDEAVRENFLAASPVRDVLGRAIPAVGGAEP